MQKFNYTLKKSKGRYLRVQVKPGGTVEVFKPRLMPVFLVERFLKQKEGWILGKIEKQKKTPPNLPLLKGRNSARKEYLEKKEEARKIVLEKLEYWKVFYKENFGVDFVWKNVSIKNSKTRWGSCSSKKNLNFSYKIIFLSPNAQDYLIVHELCHLIHMNHSKNFWYLVQKGIPEYKKLRKILKNNNLNH